METPANGFYYHYKHDPSGAFNNYAYEVCGVARHSEDKSFLVMYRPLYESEWLAPATMCIRPLEMFMEDVSVDGKTLLRFARITDPELISKLEVIQKEMYDIQV
jgi:hypothetical protein